MKTNIKHIVFLTPGFAASHEDSTSIPALQVYLKALRNAQPDIEMTVIAFQFPFSNKTYQWNGITVLPLNGKNQRIKKLWTWYNAIKTLNKLHKTKPISCVHSFWIGECSTIGNRFAKEHNIKHLVTVMGQDAQVGNLHANKLQNSNVEIVTLSNNQQSQLLKKHKLKSTIIPWCLDISSFPELKDKTIDILGVGSLNKIKNYTVFIDIVLALSKTHPNLKVEIIGEGQMKTVLSQKIKALGLDDIILLIGKRPRAEVLNKMAKSKILLHTSIYESFGFVFIEALYSGMHIVSYSVGCANNLKQWHIVHSKNEFIEACSSILVQTKATERVILHTKKHTINRYFKLYNA